MSSGHITYNIASRIWTIAKWTWTVVVVVILTGISSTFLTGSKTTLLSSIFAEIVNWFTIMGVPQRLTIGIIISLTLLALAAGILVTALRSRYGDMPTPSPETQEVLEYIKQEKEVAAQKAAAQKEREKEAFGLYLRSLAQVNKDIRPRGLAQFTRALLFADVPLDDIFTPLRIVPDAPVYDAPDEQLRQLAAIRQRTDLSAEERDAYIQQLRIVWYSQIRQDVDEKKAQQFLQFEDMLQRLTGVNPVAILLGTPGSGKTTFLRWIALHMVGATGAALSSSTYNLPQGISRVQVPLFIQTGEYAERLEKEQQTLKQFLIAQWNIIHPNLAVKLLDELRQGRCLVLFDGLDQGPTFSVRRRVLENIEAFITEYSSGDSSNYNCFIISSRIADSEPGVFTTYPHYTLLSLDEPMVKQVLSKWCFALARYKAMATEVCNLSHPRRMQMFVSLRPNDKSNYYICSQIILVLCP